MISSDESVAARTLPISAEDALALASLDLFDRDSSGELRHPSGEAVVMFGYIMLFDIFRQDGHESMEAYAERCLGYTSAAAIVTTSRAALLMWIYFSDLWVQVVKTWVTLFDSDDDQLLGSVAIPDEATLVGLPRRFATVGPGGLEDVVMRVRADARARQESPDVRVSRARGDAWRRAMRAKSNLNVVP